MGLYEEAVELALKVKICPKNEEKKDKFFSVVLLILQLFVQVNIELAKKHAQKVEDDDALKKKLWLRIARCIVEEKKNIKG